MKRIVKEGTEYFKLKCTVCACEFIYEMSDIDFIHYGYLDAAIIQCPCCQHTVPHVANDPLNKETYENISDGIFH